MNSKSGRPKGWAWDYASTDRNNQYRAILENDPPSSWDRVNTPRDRVPEAAEYNRPAYVEPAALKGTGSQ